MTRPRSCKIIDFNPRVKYFKPQGIPMKRLEVVYLIIEEMEALRLKNIEKLDQIEIAKKMKTSQSTIQRLLSSAYEKITDALINGKAIRISQ